MKKLIISIAVMLASLAWGQTDKSVITATLYNEKSILHYESEAKFNDFELWYNFPKDAFKVVVGDDTVRTDLGVYQTMVILTMLQQWDQYSKECYADSTVNCPSCESSIEFQKGIDEYWIKCYGSSYWERGYYPPSTLCKITICGNCGTLYLPNKHKKQSSFSDFMIWLKQKTRVSMKKDSILYIKVNGNIGGNTHPDQKMIINGVGQQDKLKKNKRQE